MAAFSFEEGMLTDVLLTCCALRTRVNMSAMGSLMLMCISPTSWLWSCPALRHALPFHAICDELNRTCCKHRANGRSPRNDCVDGSGLHCAAVVAVAGGPDSVLRRTCSGRR